MSLTNGTTAAPPGEAVAKLESTWTTWNGLRLHARVAQDAAGPDAPAVVLVHGVGVSSRYLIPTAERLAPYYRVFAPDLPGFGRSDKPNHILNILELTDALAGWLTRAGTARAAFLGNSMGCQIIVDLAVRYPEKVASAVLVGPTLDANARSLLRQLGRGARDLFGEPLTYWPLLAMDYWIAGPLRTVRTLALAVRDPLTEKLPKVRVPTLVVRGSKDPIAPADWCAEMVRLLPRGRLVVLDGVHHVANYTHPAELVRVVRAFLNDLKREDVPAR